jgi:putative hemolysin
MPVYDFSIPIIGTLILASGFVTLFDQALKTVRIPRLQKEAADAENQGGRFYRRAQKYRSVIEAAEKPEMYFTSSRIWICSLRTVAAVLGGLDMGRRGDLLPAAIAGYTAALIGAFLLFGELIPGIAARSAPERIALALLPLFRVLSRTVQPLFNAARTAGERLRLVLPSRAGLTEDELRLTLMEGEKSGVVESKERLMVEGVFYLGDKPLGAFMTHRSEIQWIDINAPPEEIRAKALEYRKQRCFPVADSTLDSIVGEVYPEDIILDLASETPAGLRGIMKKAQFVPETMPALKAFEAFKRGEADFLFVMDEYGGLAGMVCARDLMEEIVGELAAPLHEEPPAVQQEDGSWIAAGNMNIDDAAALFSLPVSGNFHTLAGFVLSLAGELPGTGDSFTYQDYRFTVLEMNGNRIERLKIMKD